ncbi:unnamed protein product [Photorhabdus laumondii subsp. laumondii TTO1]|uniref:Photorhabdus luminescens subsp. laumondii TTO1 complete genome segment 12/17 n=1 Tax=Photorhabdus laumondii subsp. laumondii (strain DSM 15139 / CIP 105565 / TT01) TaxID=243265 RepID=Q7N210_PHOLL|nr:unnamed protein product [Photorhabdus laumondii subsp. laumondii TTO1]
MMKFLLKKTKSWISSGYGYFKRTLLLRVDDFVPLWHQQFIKDRLRQLNRPSFLSLS